MMAGSLAALATPFAAGGAPRSVPHPAPRAFPDAPDATTAAAAMIFDRRRGR